VAEAQEEVEATEVEEVAEVAKKVRSKRDPRPQRSQLINSRPHEESELAKLNTQLSRAKIHISS
jgi:hypothetical protein